jgi:hypothetical protein
VQRYAPEMARRLRSSLNSTNDGWRVDETYIPGQGQVGVFVPRGGFHRSDHRLPAFQPGATPWPPSAFRAKALGQQNHPAPRVINTDKDTAYPPAIVGLKAEGALEENCRHRPVQYLEQRLGTGSPGHQAPGPRQPAFSLLLEGAWRTKSRLRSDAYDSQRPGVLGCGGCEGRSTAPLHCWSLRGDQLSFRSLS